MTQNHTLFEQIIRTQAEGVESLMTNCPTTQQEKMNQAKQLLKEAVLLAIDAGKHQHETHR
jgi:hypothetical protein